ncbi:hypothetical protein Tco_1560499, partial [Tanacetum coccineum]
MIMTMSVEWWSGVEMMKVLWGGRSSGGSSEVAARWEKAAGMEVVSWGCEGDDMIWWGGCRAGPPRVPQHRMTLSTRGTQAQVRM